MKSPRQKTSETKTTLVPRMTSPGKFENTKVAVTEEGARYILSQRHKAFPKLAE